MESWLRPLRICVLDERSTRDARRGQRRHGQQRRRQRQRRWRPPRRHGGPAGAAQGATQAPQGAAGDEGGAVDSLQRASRRGAARGATQAPRRGEARRAVRQPQRASRRARPWRRRRAAGVRRIAEGVYQPGCGSGAPRQGGGGASAAARGGREGRRTRTRVTCARAPPSTQQSQAWPEGIRGEVSAWDGPLRRVEPGKCRAARRDRFGGTVLI